MAQRPLRARQRLGKYRIDGCLGDGGYAAVYRATDTLEGVRVALKIPYEYVLMEGGLDDFRNEIHLAATLKHPHILPLKNADFIEDRLVLAYPLGDRTLSQRMHSRLSLATVLDFAGQMLSAVAYAHEQRVIHCDLKPDNWILFDHLLRLTDFGLAKISAGTMRASGSGTIGYCAPEQAMGKPSFRSDVFSLGLLLYRLLSGKLPEWPFDWPPPGLRLVRRKVHPDVVAFLRRAISVDPRQRFATAGIMLNRFNQIKPYAVRSGPAASARASRVNGQSIDWRTLRRRQFQRDFGRVLETIHRCRQCRLPIAEPMTYCPWCGDDRAVHQGKTRYPQQCPRCRRGLKLDWPNCPWCYGFGFDVVSTRQYADSRYTANCSNPGCSRKRLMPFMRYCPWCRRKVRRKWKIHGSESRCGACGWGVAAEYWSFCAWCGKETPRIDGRGR